eukprot:1334295-Amorphochlora_amoeboformis.AAC.1
MAGPLARLGTFAHFLLALSFLPIPPIAAQAQEDLTNLPVPTITSANEGDFEAEIADTLTKSEPLKAPLLNVKNKMGGERELRAGGEAIVWGGVKGEVLACVRGCA